MDKRNVIACATPILRKHNVRRAALFGSTARNEQKDCSDVDFLVELEDGKSLLDLVGLKIDLEEAMGVDVDVITYDSINPLLRGYILREQVPFYEA
jgi:predicted nucleotidyltransferase